MKNALQTIIASLFFTCSAHAAPTCTPDQIEVTVLPFNITTDTSLTYRELVAIGVGGAEVGMVRQTTTVKAAGCKVTVGYADPVLYIAKELKRDHCAFEHVMEHEQQHVRIYRENLIGIEDRIKSRAASGSLFEAAVAEVDAVIPLHKAHDSPEEYATNGTACSGAVVRLAMARRF